MRLAGRCSIGWLKKGELLNLRRVMFGGSLRIGWLNLLPRVM